MTKQKEFDFLEKTIQEIRNGASLEDVRTKLIIRKHDIKKQLRIGGVVFSEEELKAQLDEQLEVVKQWLISEDFEGLAERL
ncbi:hypothetical protein [Tenacibaculum finnmarkense]|uniref:hypothetical protein n=1 Tax=Tenacibaculum finnmarkense TaxID=2781243 RepID=UPI00187B9138|nr:hypothetical protein [Tenacibaculum finnmarkense]MBE7649142.1 hypothetical protein [Tenacibaculum finnmarkense genomovar ulcerans]